MNHAFLTTCAVVVLLLVATSTGPAAPGAETNSVTSQHGEPIDSTAGERFAGTVGSERAAVTGTLRVAAFEQAYATADTDAERAAVSADYLERAERRLTALDERRTDLRERREAGDVSEGAYHAYLQRVRGDADALILLSRAIENRTDALPADQRREYGVTEADIHAVEADALELRESLPSAWVDSDASVYDDVEAFVARFNERADGSEVLVDRLAGERVTLEIEMAGGPVVVSFTVDDGGTIGNLAAGAHADPTLRVHTDRETLRDLAETDDPVVRLQRAVDDDDVSFQGVGALKRVEWGIIELLADVS